MSRVGLRGGAAAIFALSAFGCTALVDLSGLSGGASFSARDGGTVEDAGPSDGTVDTRADANGPRSCDAANIATDPNHCGACGRVCTTSCSGGLCAPETVATGIVQAGCLVLDGPYVQWSSASKIVWTAKSGGAAQSFVAGDRGEIVDCLNTSDQTYSAFASAVFLAAVRTPPPMNDYAVYSRSGILRLALGPGKHLFMVRSDGIVERCSKGDLNCVDKSSAIYADGTHDLRGIAVDSSRVYWTSHDDGVIRSLSQSAPQGSNGTPPFVGYEVPVTVVAAAGSPTALLASGADLLWIDDAGRIMRARADGSGAPIEIATNQSGPIAIAADVANVYWATAAGALWRAGRAGGQKPLLLATGNASRIALDETHLYWIERSASGSLYRVAK